MTKLRTIAFMTVAALSLSACMSEGVDADSNSGLVQITHTTKGSLYWQ